MQTSNKMEPVPEETPSSATKDKAWWGNELAQLRHKMRQQFNRAKNTKRSEDWGMYKHIQTTYKTLIRKQKRQCPSLSPSPDKETDSKTARILRFTHSDIMVELQSKYPGLHDLSKKKKHQLLDNISKTIIERLKKIMEMNHEAAEKCFLLSRHYRRVHPHFGDFQLVLDALHRLQDAAGAPREPLTELDIGAVTIKPAVIDNVPFDKVKQACNKYCDRIANKVSEHISNLNTEVQDTDSEEQIVRKRVRGELKKLQQFVPTIIRQVIMKHFILEQSKSHPIHLYGEPFLPPKETVDSFLRLYRPVKLNRSKRMYNLLMFSVSPENYPRLMAMDGTVLNGAKLVIRPFDMPFYIPPSSSNANPDEFLREPMDEDMEEL